MNYQILEKLAKENKWQILFNRAKELSGLQLFNNNTDFSRLQIEFLYFLSLYSMLYQDLNSGEEWITLEVIEDSIRVEAYLLLRQILKEEKKNPKLNGQQIDTTGIGSMIFRKKR